MDKDTNQQWATKKVSVSGFTQGMRKSDFERIKEKLSKKGWEPIEFHDAGMSGSYATFRRPLSYKEDPFRPTKQHIIGGMAALLFLVAIIAIRSGDDNPKENNPPMADEQQSALPNKSIEEEKPTPEEKLAKYKDYVNRLTNWSDKADRYHQLALLSLQKTKDPVQLYQDVETAKYGLYSLFASFPSSPDEETVELYDAVLRTYSQRQDAWEAMLEYLENKNIKDLSEFRKTIKTSNEYWVEAVAELTKLNLKIKEMEKNRETASEKN